jgi:hypothetical protein
MDLGGKEWKLKQLGSAGQLPAGSPEEPLVCSDVSVPGEVFLLIYY